MAATTGSGLRRSPARHVLTSGLPKSASPASSSSVGVLSARAAATSVASFSRPCGAGRSVQSSHAASAP